MKKCLRIILFFNIIILSSWISAQDLSSKIDAYFNEFIQGEVPGAAVLVSRDGKILFQKGFGFADLENDSRITPQTQFRIGSTSKQFTAAAVLKLQEDGKLSVSDPLRKFFPDYPRGDEVTLHHLLTHTSGIRSFTEIPGFFDRVGEEISPENMIAFFIDQPYDFGPGESWHYSNSGYFLLGRIVELISGLSLGEYLDRIFFRPLGMKSTGVHSLRSPPPRDALGYAYDKDGDEFRRALNWDMSHAGGAGNLYSTVGDLFIWNEAVFHHKILKKASLDAAFTPVRLNTGEKPDAVVLGADYGYGWLLDEYKGFKRISHAGGFHGFYCEFIRFPDANVTIAILTNCIPVYKLNGRRAAEKIADWVLGLETDQPIQDMLVNF